MVHHAAGGGTVGSSCGSHLNAWVIVLMAAVWWDVMGCSGDAIGSVIRAVEPPLQLGRVASPPRSPRMTVVVMLLVS